MDRSSRPASANTDLSFLPPRVAKLTALGWRLIPQTGDKHPPIRWREFQDRSPTTTELRRWSLDFPNCMWAVVTGLASGVIVLDFDVKDGGMDVLRRLGLHPSIRTPSGGAHVYVRAPKYPVRGGARVDPESFPGMDLRADGQLATVSGTNPVRGGSYERAEGRRSLYAIDELPSELQQLILGRRKVAREAPSLAENFSDFASSNELIAEAVEMVRAGSSRNSAGFHLACQLRDERFTLDDAEALVDQYAKLVTAGDHPYSRQEAYNSLLSAFSSPPREPRALSKKSHGDGFRRTDYGNAERLVAAHGEDLRYATFSRKWLVWPGTHWAVDDTGEISRRAKSTVREMMRAAVEVEDGDDRQRSVKWAMASESASKLAAMETLARTEAGVAVAAHELDTDPMLIAVKNGTVDLRTGVLHESRRSDLMTKLAPVVYKPEAKAPRWLAFLRRIVPDVDVRDFLQRAVGYSLTGTTTEHVAFMLYGHGANGKSTFLEALRQVIGDYAQQAPSDLLLAKRSTSVPSDVARIRGARMVTITETDEGRQIAEAFFKQMTGGDRVSARFLYGEWFEFDSVAKFWLATNHKPEVRGTGEAIWRRILLTPFEVTIPHEERDPRLAAALREELAGIFAWAVEGAIAWQATGLQVPACIRKATDEYKDEMDSFADFLEGYCEVGANFHITSSQLFALYEQWATEEGIVYKWTKKRLGSQLIDRGFVAVKSGGVRGWRGLRERGRRVHLSRPS